MVTNHCTGYLAGAIVTILSNFHVQPRRIWFTLPAEAAVSGDSGKEGQAGLSKSGRESSKKLRSFIEKQVAIDSGVGDQQGVAPSNIDLFVVTNPHWQSLATVEPLRVIAESVVDGGGEKGRKGGKIKEAAGEKTPKEFGYLYAPLLRAYAGISDDDDQGPTKEMRSAMGKAKEEGSRQRKEGDGRRGKTGSPSPLRIHFFHTAALHERRGHETPARGESDSQEQRVDEEGNGHFVSVRQAHRRRYSDDYEGYADLAARLARVIIEVERMRDDVLIVSPPGALVLLLRYFLGQKKADSVALSSGVIYEIIPRAYGTDLVSHTL